MAVKSYLSKQFRLVCLTTYDLFTEEEFSVYMEAVDLINQMKRFEADQPEDKTQLKLLNAQKKQRLSTLSALTLQHSGTPRTVRLNSVLFARNEPLPAVTWKGLKITKKISEFECEMSRAMELKTNDHTLDMVVLKWKSVDVLKQLVYDGFIMPILLPDGTVENRLYHFFSASAGQLRTDKAVFISNRMIEKVRPRIECGLTWEIINAQGGINMSKLLAYKALAMSATDPWPEFDIDRVIVIQDWEGEVTDRMMYIKPDYTEEIGVFTVKIKHTDGAGMMLPSVSKKNFMVRAAYIKGLLCSFDFMEFCKVHHVEPVLTDAWGIEHDLIKENIQIILTASQFKLWSYYKNFDEYRKAFKENHCQFGKTNYEEEYLPNKKINYQMIQTLVDFSDEEIKRFTAPEHERIKNLTNDKSAMLKTLRAEEHAKHPLNQALYWYPELLRDSYVRKQLKDIKKRMLLDAKSGAIQCANKRLYAIPDWYAACQYYFLHDSSPQGLLENGEVACKPLSGFDRADVLRSPHLYCEHAIRTITHDRNIYKWFYTDGIYTSCHDLISRILQFDVDGDMLNVVTDPVILTVAERNLKEFDVIPLFYDANKAPSEICSRETEFEALKRAHDFSNIGEISNNLTKLWNKDHPDRLAAALLCYKNNLVIDAAKTGWINDYTAYPNVAQRISKATGGKTGSLPYFFQFSKNGRKNPNVKVSKKNNSTMNRICSAFDDIGNINMNYAGVGPLNWEMLLSEPCTDTNDEIVSEFCDMDSINLSKMIEACSYSEMDWDLQGSYDMLAEMIEEVLVEKYGSLEHCYPYIVKHLFSDEGQQRNAHKQMFWRVFGSIAVNNIKENICSYSVCNTCQMKIPKWASKHQCKIDKGFFRCSNCGEIFLKKGHRQFLCSECKDKYRTKTEHKRYINDKLTKQKEQQEKVKAFLRKMRGE